MSAHAVIPSQQQGNTWCLRIGNLSAQDARFLRQVAGLFCDPLYERLAEQIRRSKASIFRDAAGNLYVIEHEVSRPFQRSNS